jgi:hypothetical protein
MLAVTCFFFMPRPMMKKLALGGKAHTPINRSELNAGKYAPYVGDKVRIAIVVPEEFNFKPRSAVMKSP